MLTEMRPFRERDRNCHILADSRWLGNALQGCWKASGQFSKGIGKLLGNAQILRCQPDGQEIELPSGYWQKRGKFPSLFSEELHFCFHLL